MKLLTILTLCLLLGSCKPRMESLHSRIEERAPLNAAADIENGTMKLFYGSGWVPKGHIPRSFKKDYGVTPYFVGDYFPYSMEEMKKYNNTIAAYLDKKFGTGWRKDVVMDI
jgi:hypothetical protein